MISVFVDNPSVLASRIALVVNDGRDYTITFAAGIYTVVSGTFDINHSGGGSITLNTHCGGDVRFQGATSFNTSISIVAQRIAIHGIHFGDDIPYYITTSTVRPVSVSIGGSASCTLAECLLTGCTFNGRSDITIYTSRDIAIYSRVRIIDCRIEDGSPADQAVIMTAPTSGSQYINASIDNLYGNAKTGPNKFIDGGPAFSSHGYNSAALWFKDLGGASTVDITRMRYTTEYFGNHSTGMTCFSVGHFNGEDVRLTFRDCTWVGRWRAGIAEDAFMTLGDVESSGPSYAVTDPPVAWPARPRLDFDNCSFTFNVDFAETESGSFHPGHMTLITFGSDVDCHLWNCRLVWGAGYHQLHVSPTTVFFLGTDGIYVATHDQSTWAAGELAYNPFNDTIEVGTDLDNTRETPGLGWGRIPTLF